MNDEAERKQTADEAWAEISRAFGDKMLPEWEFKRLYIGEWLPGQTAPPRRQPGHSGKPSRFVRGNTDG